MSLFGNIMQHRVNKPCRNAKTAKLIIQPGKYYQQKHQILCQNSPYDHPAWQVLSTKNPKILTKRFPVGTTVPSGKSPIIGPFVYRGIPSDPLSRPEKSHHLSGALHTRRLKVFERSSFQRASSLWHNGA